MVHLFVVSFSLLFASFESGLRIIGGRDAHQDEFPYVVSLEMKKKVSEDTIYNYHKFCTGSALSSKWVLSAAHCVWNFHEKIFKKNNLFIRYNSYFPNNMGLLAPFLEAISHPGHDRVTKKFDFALIRSAEIQISQYGKISAVDFKSLIGHEALSLGYGKTNSSQFKVPLQVLKGMLNRCLEKEIKWKQLLCLVPQCNVEATICGGDSGGPVVHPAGIVGVNSMSRDDCFENTTVFQPTPGCSASILSPISPVLDWIRNYCK